MLRQPTFTAMTPNHAQQHDFSDRDSMMMDMPTRLQVVEDDLDDSIDDRRSAAPVLVVKPIATRPTPMKVLRPIAKRVSEQFYNEACNEGLTMQETRQVAALANDWHRKWTLQDEQGHTTPNQDFYQQQSFIASPAVFDAELDRRGAMNPSLGDSGSSSHSYAGESYKSQSLEQMLKSPSNSFTDHCMPLSEVLFLTEDRMSVTGWSSSSSSLSSFVSPQVQRMYTDASIEEEDEYDYPQALMVRPVAVRVARPILPPAPHDITHGDVPHDITASVHRPVVFSPVSFSSSVTSETFMMSLANKQASRSQPHFIDDDEDERDGKAPTSFQPFPSRPLARSLQMSRDGVLHALAVTQGDVESEKFKLALAPLMKYFADLNMDTRPTVGSCERRVEGMWLTLSKPTYFSNLGENDNGDPMYTLGRMAFDMFSPTNLVCSLQGNFNPVEVVNEEERKLLLGSVPKGLREEVESGETVLRTYHVVAAFTIEPNVAGYPNAPNKDANRPIKGIMTTYGYSLGDPKTSNRHSIWFTGGRIEPNNNPADIMAWKRLFTKHPPQHTFGEKAKLLAVKMLMGATVPEKMNEDGSMEYVFTRPLGGHGMAYVDIVYLDETLRIVKGHRGTVMVFSRVPQR